MRIRHGNALQTDWAQVLPPAECSFIVGNPPFVGYSYQSKEQKADLERVYQGAAGTGVLDFVAAWWNVINWTKADELYRKALGK